MNSENIFLQAEMCDLSEKLLKAEKERLAGLKTYTLEEVKRHMENLINSKTDFTKLNGVEE